MLTSFASGAVFGSRYGCGRPWLVALHGWDRTHADFDRAFGESSPDGPSDGLAIDLPGFGATPPPPVAWGSAEYAAFLEPLVAEVAAERGGPVVVVGHSFGGRVAVLLGASRPDLVKGLVLTGVPLLRRDGPRPAPATAYRLARAANRIGLIGAGRMEQYRRRYGSADYRKATGTVRDSFVRLVNEDYGEVLAKLACPVELVWGSRDDQVPPEVARRVAAMLPDARLTECDGVGHLLPLEAPAALRAAAGRLR